MSFIYDENVFSIMEENVSKQIKELKLKHAKEKYQPKCRRCKEQCIARNMICVDGCEYNNKGYCSKYKEDLELFEGNIYFRTEDCYDSVVNKYLEDKI